MKQQCKKGTATPEDVRAATGLLRIENRVRGTASINALAKKVQVTASSGNLVTMNTAAYMVDDALSELRLRRPKASASARMQMLIEKFGKKAPEMIGVLELRAHYGEDFWKILGWSQATYYRTRRQLRQANLWDTSPLGELPALALDLDSYNKSNLLSDLRILGVEGQALESSSPVIEPSAVM